jgi:hypothetical protein
VIRSQPGELIPAAVRAAVSDGLSGYTLGEIRQWHATEHFFEPSELDLGQGQMRRTLVAAIDSKIDFSDPTEAQRYLRVVERFLEQLGDTAKRTEHPWADQMRTKILRELARADIVPDARERLLLPSRVAASRTLASAPGETGIRLAITGLERSGIEPEERIGLAKELVEAAIKFALDQLGETYSRSAGLGDLAKQLHGRLRIDPAGVAPTARGAATIVRVLGGLANIPAGLAELRNEGYGTGHGRAMRIAGIKERHADLAARSAIAYATFVLDTVNDPGAPWRA